jgi:hypothetical protein
MASTCAIYKGSRQIGTGSIAAAGTSITSFTQTDAVYTTKASGVFGRNVKIVITQAGTLLGYSFNTRITADAGAGTVTILDACPFVGA